jgi:trypsin-like peptidase
MKTFWLPLLLFFTSAGALAQSQSSVSPQAATTVQRVPFGKELRKTVGLLTVSYIKDGAIWQVNGTCFFVYFPDERVGKDRGFVYMVTNRHVAVPGIEDGHTYTVGATTLRLNRIDSANSDEKLLPLGASTLHWYFPTDPAVDLAILPFAPDQSIYEVEPFPISMFATKEQVSKENISEGDAVVFTGFFYQFPGLKRFQPIVRQGVLAMLPDEQLETTLHGRGNLYLADLHVFGGNSGSPLLVNVGGARNGSLSIGSKYELLGIISGFYHEDSNLTLTIATTYQATLEQNSGIAMVVRIDALKELLESDEVEAARKATVATIKQSQ